MIYNETRAMARKRWQMLAAACVVVTFVFVISSADFDGTNLESRYDATLASVAELEATGLLASAEDLGKSVRESSIGHPLLASPGSPALQFSDASGGKNNLRSRILFITSHGGNNKDKLNNVWMFNYSNSGKHLHHWKFQGLALDHKLVKKLQLQNLRGMKAVGDSLFIASAHSSTSKIVRTKKCSSEPRDGVTFSGDNLDHPYDLTFYKNRLFTGSQNSGDIVWYHLSKHDHAKAHKFANIKDPRGLEVDRYGNLWASSTKDGVFVFNADSGEKIAHIKIKHPVGLQLDFLTNKMYVGSVKDNCLYQVNTATFQVERKLTPEKPYKLKHPAGIAVVNDRVFAIAQKERNLYAWDTKTGKFKGAILENLPPTPEQLVMLAC